MLASEWIDRVKKAHGWTSDYKAAQELEITRGSMSEIRNGHTLTLREDTAIKVAKALGAPPEAVVLDQYAERTKAPEIREALRAAAHRLYIM